MTFCKPVVLDSPTVKMRRRSKANCNIFKIRSPLLHFGKYASLFMVCQKKAKITTINKKNIFKGIKGNQLSQCYSLKKKSDVKIFSHEGRMQKRNLMNIEMKNNYILMNMIMWCTLGR